tara:strand:- start:5018 stop:5653 length:636 start_codon:yes stop_codon:yes gene_type:complete
MSGQINRRTALGEAIFNIASNTSYKSYLEIGTWNGQGSTKCFLDGLLPRDDEWSFYSLESDPSFYNQAINFWSDVEKNPKVNLLLGRIIDEDELIDINNLKKQDPVKKEYPIWKQNDLNNYQQVENIAHLLPEFFDVILLDGGEFSTLAEFHKLKNKCSIFILDDTNELKTKECQLLLEASPDWVACERDDYDRHGYSIYKKISNEPIVTD